MFLTSDQVQKLLNEPIYSWDVSVLLAGIVDYLQFSEQHLDWQRRQEVKRAREEADSLEFEPEDVHLLSQARKQIVESAELRFDIGLSQRVRYAGIVAYVTSIEWCMKLFAARLVNPMPDKPRRKNEAVHTLGHLNTLIPEPLSIQTAEFERVITVRNCIVHAAGLVNGYQYESEVRDAVQALDGFAVSDGSHIGDTIHITAGAVNQLARRALVWIPALDKECSLNGSFKQPA